MSREVLARLNDPAIVALRLDGDAWPRGLLSVTLVPDGWMALVEGREGWRRFVPAGEDPRCKAGDRLALVRNRALTVPIEAVATPAASGHPTRAKCELLVRVPARDDEIAAFGRTLLDQPVLAADRLAKWLAEVGAGVALHGFIREHEAPRLVHEDMRDALQTHLNRALSRAFFDAGLMLERVATLRCESDALAAEEDAQRETARNMQRIQARQAVEQAALAATSRRLDSLRGILDKLRDAAGVEAGVRWSELLPSLSPAERGKLLENLWRVTPDVRCCAAIIAVGGSECVWLDPVDPEKIVRRISLPADLGALRSVRFDERRSLLLVGAAEGVWSVASDSGEIRDGFAAADASPQRTGFNAAVIAGSRLYATHSGLGCWSWPLATPKDATVLFEPQKGVPRTIRAVVADEDGGVYFAADRTVYCIDPAEGVAPLATATAAIHVLAVLERAIFAGTEDGCVLRCDFDRPDGWQLVHRAHEPIESLEVRRWDDLIEIVVPEGARGVRGVFIQEQMSAALLAPPTSVRRAWVCDDVIVALNDTRDRVIVLNGNLPDRAGRDVALARLLGRSVQDLCLITTRAV